MNKYEILKQIGEGEYGVVLLGRNKETGELVAIKKFKEDDSDEENKRLILREVKILKTLGHENIIELKEAFRKKGKIYLVCEYVQKNLLQIVEEGPIPPNMVRHHAYHLIRGIAYMHSVNIIHRDIKPENVLIGKGNALKICDLGFARTLPHSQKMTEYVATRWYRPPELLIGGQQYDTSIDMWSAGCVIAEMIDGEPLFPGENDLDQLYLVQKCLGPLIPQQKELFLKNPKFIGMKFPEIHNLESIDRRYFGKIDKQGLDLLKKLITMDPAQRLTPEQALRHPYLSKVAGHEMPRKNGIMARERDEESQQLQSNLSNNVVGRQQQRRPNIVTGLLRSKKVPAEAGASVMRQNIMQREDEAPKGKSVGSKKINILKDKMGGNPPLTDKRNRVVRNKARHRHRPQQPDDEMEEYYQQKWESEEQEEATTHRKKPLNTQKQQPRRREESESPVRKSKIFSKNYRKDGYNIVFNNNTYNLNIVDPYS